LCLPSLFPWGKSWPEKKDTKLTQIRCVIFNLMCKMLLFVKRKYWNTTFIVQSRLSYVTLQRTFMRRSQWKGVSWSCWYSLTVYKNDFSGKKPTFSRHNGINTSIQCNACITDFL
jgi:hypothetical protein